MKKYMNIHIHFGGGCEYLPYEIMDPQNIYKMDPDLAYIGEEKIKGTKYPNSYFEFYYDKTKEAEVMVPFTYYYGYVANITTSKGEVYPLETYKGEDGFLRVKIKEGLAGKVLVWYNGTRIQKISLLISIVSSTLLIAYITIQKIKEKSGKNNKI